MAFQWAFQSIPAVLCCSDGKKKRQGRTMDMEKEGGRRVSKLKV